MAYRFQSENMSHNPVINVQVGFEIDHRELEAPLCTRRTSAGHSSSLTLFGAALHRCLIGCTWMARSVRKLDCPPDSRTEMPTRPSTLILKLLLLYCGCCVGVHDKTLQTSKLFPRPGGISKVGPHPPSMVIREPFEVEPVDAVIGCLGGHVHGC